MFNVTRSKVREMFTESKIRAKWRDVTFIIWELKPVDIPVKMKYIFLKNLAFYVWLSSKLYREIQFLPQRLKELNAIKSIFYNRENCCLLWKLFETDSRAVTETSQSISLRGSRQTHWKVLISVSQVNGALILEPSKIGSCLPRKMWRI
jgi:hypothetical protein